MSNFKAPNAFADPEDSQLVADAKRNHIDPVEYSYTERDVILYNIGIGATAKELQWTYEGHDEFSALPTFGVIPQFHASTGIPLDWLPNFNPVSQLLTSCVCHPLCSRRNYFMENNIWLSEVTFPLAASW
jgi:hypothetical protein